MANNPIYGKDIYQTDGSLEKLIEDLTNIDGKLKNVEATAKSLQSATQKMNATNKVQREEIKNNAVQTEKLAREHIKLKESYTSTAVEIQKIQAIRKKQNTIQKLELKLNKAEAGSYDQLSAKYSLIKIKLNAMSKAKRESTAAGRALVKQSKELYTEMSRLQKQTGKNQLDVGKYSQGMKQAAGSLLGFASGVGAAILVVRKIGQEIKEGIKVWSDYSKATSKVKAISGATADEMKMLSAQAEALGESTEKTAANVSELQLELAKLGFDPKQIQSATGSILDLSTAIDAELGESATVVGQTLRAFDLSAKETQRVTDVMAASFSKSSLDISKFSSAMSIVAPVAKTFGFNIEEATALVAQLTDAGFDASSAGTALRNILLNLADSNGDLAKALGGSVTNADELLDGLDKLSAQGVDLNKTLQLTDKRSVAAFNRFLNATDSTRKLTKELIEAENSAARMAEIMRDNLAGDTDKANSAMEGLYINLGKRLDPALRSATQGWTKFVGKMNELISLKPSEELKAEQVQLNILVGAATSAATSMERRNEFIKDLQKKYPSFLANMDAEKVSNEELRDRLREVNEEYKQKIIQLAKTETIKKYSDKLVKLVNKEKDILLEIGEIEQDNSNQSEYGQSVKNETLAIWNNALSINKKKQEDIQALLNQELEQLDKMAGAKKEDNKISNEGIKIEKERNKLAEEGSKIEKEYTNTLKALKEQLAQLREEKELIKLDDLGALILKEQEIKQLEELIKNYESLGQAMQMDEFEGDDTENVIMGDVDTSKGAAMMSEMRLSEIQEAIDRAKAIEEIEQKHVNSIFDIFSKGLTLRNAEREKMNAEEIALEEEKNQKISEGLSTATEFAIDQLAQLFDYQMEMAEQEYEIAQRNTDLTWNALEAEIQAREQGLANNVATKTKEYEVSKRQEQKALKDKEKAAKQQQAIDSITQASSLITASANIWSSMSSIPVVGSILALAAIALMWGSFAYSKTKANQVTKYEKGGAFDISGGTHVSGNDTSLGVHNGSERKVQRGEKVGIINNKAVQKYGSKNINALIDDINKGSYSMNVGKSIVGEADMPQHLLVGAGHDSVDLRNLEANVKAIKEQGQEKWSTDKEGRRVRYYKNLKQIYIK